ncbi:MAG: diaminobutyrate--2-oxoglutarate transaminase [Alphaproteobacteria bacterium BRH_c36]|nr:MAG: diaminobutyrate--2-oxoglutarate transaminase [Alphaproteobacteria bacterium BRH_c36]
MLEKSKSVLAYQATIFDRLESGVQSYARCFPTTFVRARGAEVWDAEGRRFVDFLAGAGSLNYGHNNPIFKEALISYIEGDGITHSLDLHTGAKEHFLNTLNDFILKPRGLDYVVQFTGPTGTNAVEAAIKLARKVTGRTNIISFTNGFHGCTLGSVALTGNKYFRDASGVPMQNATSMPYDGYFGDGVDTIAYLEMMLSDPSSGVSDPAAVILETVQGEGGLRAARTEWLRRLQALCRARNILLIVDDIQAGCGRTGSFFSFEPAGIVPDIVTLSKSLSAFGLPMAIVLINRSIDCWKPGEHNGTFRGNNHAFVTAATAIEHYWSSASFTESIAQKSRHLGERLQRLVDRFPSDLCEVRGRGMMRGIRCIDPAKAAMISAKAYENGLIIERSGPHDEVIKCLMPLTIENEQFDEGLDILGSAFETVCSAQNVRSINGDPAMIFAAE